MSLTVQKVEPGTTIAANARLHDGGWVVMRDHNVMTGAPLKKPVVVAAFRLREKAQRMADSWNRVD